MSTASPTIRDFARRLIALGAARDQPPAAAAGDVVRVCDRLRVPLARLAGEAGFRSLLSRAVAMAKAEFPSLAAVQVRADGSLEGLDQPRNEQGAGSEAGVAVVAHLIGLLMTFIGDPLTMGLVRDAWPEVSLTGIDAGSGEGS